MGKMIKVEGFKAFRGLMKIRIVTDEKVHQDEFYGDWLYMPDTDCWYHKGASFPAAFCEVLKVE